jgi:hypothetical protein
MSYRNGDFYDPTGESHAELARDRNPYYMVPTPQVQPQPQQYRPISRPQQAQPLPQNQPVYGFTPADLAQSGRNNLLGQLWQLFLSSNNSGW